MDCNIDHKRSDSVEDVPEIKLTAQQRARRKYQQKPEVKAKYRNFVKKHYDEHKIDIQEKRRKKREEDPEYAEKCKEINREAARRYREKKKLLQSSDS